VGKKIDRRAAIRIQFSFTKIIFERGLAPSLLSYAA